MEDRTRIIVAGVLGLIGLCAGIFGFQLAQTGDGYAKLFGLLVFLSAIGIVLAGMVTLSRAHNPIISGWAKLILVVLAALWIAAKLVSGE